MKLRRLRKSITLLTILAMLFLLLPIAVMAVEEGNGTKALPGQARAHWVRTNHPVDEQELEEEELEEENEEEEMGEPSERARFVAERNRQAKEWGLPPGFVNLFDKLSDLTLDTTGQTRLDIYTRFTSTEFPMRIKDLAKEIKDARMALEMVTESLPVEQ